MSELGRLLSAEREAKGLSLDEVEAATRIRQKYLQALEKGAFEDLPRGAVARGFLRTYAGYLGLDVEQAMRLYATESGDAGNDVDIAEPGKPRLVDYRPLEVELMDTRPVYAWARWLAAALIVAGVAATIWYLWNRGTIHWPVRSVAPTATSTATSTATPTETRWVVTATPRPTATPTVIPPTPTSDLLTLPTPTVQPTATFTPLPTPTAEVFARISLKLDVQEKCWVSLVVDGERVEHAVLDPGYSAVWEADNSIVIRLGNAIGVTLTLNGVQLEPLGARNEVVDRVWSVEGGEVVEQIDGSFTPVGPATPTPTPSG